jgi:acyl-CoA reductase-like NAD-dependent aldehyde dehydrogenase
MATLRKIEAASLKHTVKRIVGDDTYNYGVYDADGVEVECCETIEEAKEAAAEMTDAAIEAAKEEAQDEYETAIEDERADLVDRIKEAVEDLDMAALMALAKRLGA